MAFAVSCALHTSPSALSVPEMGRHGKDFGNGVSPGLYNLVKRQPRHTIKFTCDGAVQGFFDDDYARGADWEHFTNKAGSLVRLTIGQCKTQPTTTRCAVSPATMKKQAFK